MRVLTDAELAQLSGYPRDIGAEDLTTFFRLDVDTRRWLVAEHRGPGNRPGAAACRPWGRRGRMITSA
jgi:hypothetical protein